MPLASCAPNGELVKSVYLNHIIVVRCLNSVGLIHEFSTSTIILLNTQVRPFSEKEKLAGTRCVISMSGNQTKILDPAYFDSEDSSSSPDDRSMW